MSDHKPAAGGSSGSTTTLVLVAICLAMVTIMVVSLTGSNNNAQANYPNYPPSTNTGRTQLPPANTGRVQPPAQSMPGVHSQVKPQRDPSCVSTSVPKPAVNAYRVRNPTTGKCSWYVPDQG